MDTLKTELLQSQKTRDDLMKWKLLLVSGIGSTALGFSGTKGFVHAELALCLIPFACCYTDLLCRNLSIRTKLLSAFLSAEVSLSPQDPTTRFEGFYQDFDEARRQQDVQGQKWRLRDALEGLALVYSTRILSECPLKAG